MRDQRGAAILLAMVVVALVSTLASAALWHQWRSTTVESAERERAQASWLLFGVLDWASLILQDDARSNQRSGEVDHLGEHWAQPLEEASLSSFLGTHRQNNAVDPLPAFLSGQVTDMQSRLNFMNTVRIAGMGAETQVEVSQPDLHIFVRLFQQLNLPQAELQAALNTLVTTRGPETRDPKPSRSAFAPTRFSQLSWLGLSNTSLAVLEPHVTVLPERTPLNLNTASAQAMAASMPGLDLDMAQRLVSERERKPFADLAEIERLIAKPPDASSILSDKLHSISSRYFEVRGRLRLNETQVEERSLLVRNNMSVQLVWRERVAR